MRLLNNMNKDEINKIIEESKSSGELNSGDISDGYHTFDELYEFRMIYNAALFNEWYSTGKYEVFKSKKHHDGNPCFDGNWFIVVAILPDGQISNHYEMKYWNLFNIPEYEKSLEFDGHTPKDVLKRIKSLYRN